MVDGKGWVVAKTKPRCEKKVAEQCELLSIEYYLPLKKSVRRYEKRKVEFTKPLFPGYIFVQLTHENESLLLSRGKIACFIQPADEQQLLDELEALKLVLEQVDSSPIVNPEIVVGNQVRIISGPMKGIVGVVSRRQGVDSISININMLGQSVTVNADANDFEKADNE